MLEEKNVPNTNTHKKETKTNKTVRVIETKFPFSTVAAAIETTTLWMVGWMDGWADGWTVLLVMNVMEFSMMRIHEISCETVSNPFDKYVPALWSPHVNMAGR